MVADRGRPPTSADYGWIKEWQRGLFLDAYCLTFVRGLAAAELLDRLAAADRSSLQGVTPLALASLDAWNAHGGRSLMVGVTQAPGWAVMLECNGYVGVTVELMAPVSAGTSVVGHYRNVNALDQFLWLEDGELRLRFEPLFPDVRNGTAADDVVDDLEAAGFDLRPAAERDFSSHTAAAFALGERITGVRVSGEMLDAATFVTGLVRLPSGS